LQLQWRCEAGFSAHGCQHFADRPSDAAALVAGTDDGVFTRAESGWQLIGLSAAAVNDIVWKAQDHLLASVEFGVDQTPDHRLVETCDGGVSWHAVEDDFGGGGGNLEADGGLDSYPGLLPGPSVSKGIRHVMGQPQRLLVSDEAGIVRTLDDGISWQTLLADDAHRFHFDVLHDVQRPRRFITAAWEKNPPIASHAPSRGTPDCDARRCSCDFRGQRSVQVIDA
jgi:hypothetical protein